MKTVIRTQEVFHFWANQAQSDARNPSRSVSFRNNTLYSYSSPVAAIIWNPAGEQAYLVDARYYSVTTAKHIAQTKRAIPVGALVLPSFTDVSVYGNNCNSYSSYDPSKTMEILLSNIVEATGKAYRARENKVHQVDSLIRNLEKCRQFAHFFGLDEPTFDVKTISICGSYHELIAGRIEKENQLKAKRQKTALKNLGEWMEGNRYISVSGLTYDYMRIDGDIIETTRGAKVPKIDVMRVMDNILYIFARESDTGYLETYFPSRTVRFGPYILHSISPDNVVTVGCHQFEQSEIIRIAQLLKG